MTLTELDISGFNYPELSELKVKIEVRMNDTRETILLCRMTSVNQLAAVRSTRQTRVTTPQTGE